MSGSGTDKIKINTIHKMFTLNDPEKDYLYNTPYDAPMICDCCGDKFHEEDIDDDLRELFDMCCDTLCPSCLMDKLEDYRYCESCKELFEIETTEDVELRLCQECYQEKLVEETLTKESESYESV